MTDLTFHDLKKKNVADLREIAKGIEHDAVQGHTQMNKDHLLQAICTALHIDMHEHHEVVGVDKSAVKKKIRDLKKVRDKALADKNAKKLKSTRQEIKKLKQQLRKAMV